MRTEVAGKKNWVRSKEEGGVYSFHTWQEREGGVIMSNVQCTPINQASAALLHCHKFLSVDNDRFFKDGNK